MIKKLLALLCSCLLLLGLAGCSDEDNPNSHSDKPVEVSNQKIGMDSIHSVTMDSTDLARIKSTVAAVILDDKGKIASCALDEMEFTVPLKDGAIQTVSGLQSKGERRDKYHPTAKEVASKEGVNTPWYKQAQAFCSYVIGKTPGEVSGIAATDGTSAAITGCHLIVTDFIRAVRKAADGAKEQPIQAGNPLAVSLSARSAAGIASQKVEYDVDMAAVTVGKGNRITGCITDTLQATLTSMDNSFTFVSGTVQSKRQKGDAYGMKGASPIKREWYEQADAFDTYAIGKTADELTGTKLNDAGKTDAIAGCTISISEIIKNVANAAQKAR